MKVSCNEFAASGIPTVSPKPHDVGKAAGSKSAGAVLICFSHLRWDFVYQRPQHLLSRFARDHRVFYFEEPVSTDEPQPWLERRVAQENVEVVVPRLPAGGDDVQNSARLRDLLDALLREAAPRELTLWYYTPMALAFSAHLSPALIVYDCMDELSAFRGAPPSLVIKERELMALADVVFTGGHSLYEAKRALHPDVHPFPSSVDVGHFHQARQPLPPPADQRDIGRPRLGFYGVLDERFDIDLIAKLASKRPDWQWVFIGPVVKIDPAELPRATNIHYLGPKTYEQLPAYLAGWDVALLPFALNASTRYISPTKTPEYLAGGKPVVSTPIADVVRTYADSGVVGIGGDARTFEQAVETALKLGEDAGAFADIADAVLGEMSWEKTWQGMCQAMDRARQRRTAARPRVQTQRVRDRARATEADYDYVVVGAGFAGAVLAERLAAGLGKRVLVLDRRDHVGGNAYDHLDEHGILVHRYGPHIFHTNSEKVVQYLSRFTDWRPYEHRVLAQVDGMLVPMPINLTTLSLLYGREFTSEQAQDFLAARAEPVSEIRTSEDAVVSQIGRELYEKFFRGYTRKQWGLDPSELDRSVAARVPTRTSRDDRYFVDSFQSMPLHGYTKMFERMLDHPNISVALATDFWAVRAALRYDRLVYTGPIDRYFDYRYGRLPYRSLRFEHSTLDTERFQSVATVNYPAESVPYTRVTEFKHLTGQSHPKTSVTYEFPCADGDPYYPVPRPENAALFERYQALADASPDVTFVGRLATYRYYNMDQVVAQALTAYARIERAGDATAPRTERDQIGVSP